MPGGALVWGFGIWVLGFWWLLVAFGLWVLGLGLCWLLVGICWPLASCWPSVSGDIWLMRDEKASSFLTGGSLGV